MQERRLHGSECDLEPEGSTEKLSFRLRAPQDDDLLQRVRKRVREKRSPPNPSRKGLLLERPASSAHTQASRGFLVASSLCCMLPPPCSSSSSWWAGRLCPQPKSPGWTRAPGGTGHPPEPARLAQLLAAQSSLWATRRPELRPLPCPPRSSFRLKAKTVAIRGWRRPHGAPGPEGTCPHASHGEAFEHRPLHSLRGWLPPGPLGGPLRQVSLQHLPGCPPSPSETAPPLQPAAVSPGSVLLAFDTRGVLLGGPGHPGNGAKGHLVSANAQTLLCLAALCPRGNAPTPSDGPQPPRGPGTRLTVPLPSLPLSPASPTTKGTAYFHTAGIDRAAFSGLHSACPGQDGWLEPEGWRYRPGHNLATSGHSTGPLPRRVQTGT